MDKIEIAYNYAKASLDNEFKTFDSLDNKANKFLTLVTFGIGVTVSLSGWGVNLFLPPKDAISCLIVFLLFLIVFFLSNAWFSIFKSIKISRVPTINLNEHVIKTLLNPDTDVAKEVLETFDKLIAAHRSTMEEKVTLLEQGYLYIKLSAVIILMLVFVIVAAKSEGLIS